MALAGCGGLTSVEADLPAGVYVLQTVNGQALPANYVVVDANNKVEFVSGSVTINADLTFTDATRFRVTQDGTVSLEDDTGSGVWEQHSNTITFLPTGGGSYTMFWDRGDRLTQVLGNVSLVYMR